MKIRRVEPEVDETFWHRMVFYAKLIPLYEIVFGLDTGDEVHVRHGLEFMHASMSQQ